jgi:prolyl-tRNA editing enzyme YbaK/EbsC (Cys-tRNA(Pro) deacylase)
MQRRERPKISSLLRVSAWAIAFHRVALPFGPARLGYTWTTGAEFAACFRYGEEVEDVPIIHRVLEELTRFALPYEQIAIDPEYADTASFCEKYGYPLDRSANTIIVGSKKEPKQYAACVVRADTRLDVNHAVKRLLGVSRLSFAKPEETMELTGMAIGGVTVLALPKDLPIYVDKQLMELDYVILGSGDRSAKIKTSPEVFRRLPSVQIVADLAIATSRT